MKARKEEKSSLCGVLMVLLAVFTTLAVALTAALLLWQDKNAPRYIHIYDNEE